MLKKFSVSSYTVQHRITLATRWRLICREARDDLATGLTSPDSEKENGTHSCGKSADVSVRDPARVVRALPDASTSSNPVRHLYDLLEYPQNHSGQDSLNAFSNLSFA